MLPNDIFILTWFWIKKSTPHILSDRLLSLTFKVSLWCYQGFWKLYRTERVNWLWQPKTNLIMLLLSLVLPKHFSLLLIHKCIMYSVYIDKLLLTYKAQIVTSELKWFKRTFFFWILHIPCLTKDDTLKWKFVGKNHQLTKLYFLKLFPDYLVIGL